MNAIAVNGGLIEEARKLGHHQTRRDAVTAALQEYIYRWKEQRILPLFGMMEYDRTYNYKSERRGKRAR